MASRGKNEHRMVFDIRGRRKHVVKAVYAVLAVLMGASLFLVVGPVNIGSLLGTSSSSSSAGSLYEEEAERIETRLKKSPEDASQLLALTRARINAGTSMITTNANGEREVTQEARHQLELASEAWSDYLEATDEPSPTGALQMSQTLVLLAETSRTNEVKPNISAATEAQEIAAEARPSLNSLSTLALLQAYNFEYSASKKTGQEAVKFAHSKFERENFENQREEVEKRAREFQKQLAEYQKASKEAGAGKENLESPFGGSLGGSSLGE